MVTSCSSCMHEQHHGNLISWYIRAITRATTKAEACAITDGAVHMHLVSTVESDNKRGLPLHVC